MKNFKLLVLFGMLLLVGSLSAQDDLYYNPSKDKVIVDDYKYKSDKQYKNTTDSYTSRSDEAAYDEEEYDYEEDYDYYYTSRIRRFQRPYYGFSFYDPVYVDMYYYDPFLSPMTTMLIYDNAFNIGFGRWNRWNSFGFYNPWGLNNWGYGYGGFNSWAWNPWNRWAGYPSYYDFNNYGFGGGYYCPPTWGNGYGYNTPRDIATNSYYGPRTGGSTRIPQTNDRDIRREGPKDVTNTPRQAESTGIPRDRNPSDEVTPRDIDRNTMPSTRTRAHEERRRSTDGGMTVPRTRTPRESDQTRTYEPPRQSFPERQRSSEWDNGNSTRSSSPRMDSGNNSNRSSGSSSGSSSSGPRSSGSSRRGGN